MKPLTAPYICVRPPFNIYTLVLQQLPAIFYPFKRVESNRATVPSVGSRSKRDDTSKFEAQRKALA